MRIPFQIYRGIQTMELTTALGNLSASQVVVDQQNITMVNIGEAKQGPIEGYKLDDLIQDCADIQAPSEIQKLNTVTNSSDQGYSDGYAQGLDQGIRDGFQRGSEQAELELRNILEENKKQFLAALKNQADHAEQLLKSIHSQKNDILNASIDDMLVLTFECICHVIGLGAGTKDGIQNLILNALSRQADRSLVHVHVHPDDAQWLRSTDSFETISNQFKIVLVSDDTVAFGGCILRYANGGLDARLEVLIAQVKSVLVGVRLNNRVATSNVL
jgi:flagellar biosynthesis/type III secretory pathway protein FliH